MSAIKLACPGCGQHIECDAGYAGMQVNCPSCQKAMTVPGAPPAPAMPSAGVACPSCGTVLAEGTVICTSCGMNLRTGKRIQQQISSAPFRPAPAAASSGDNTNKIAIGTLVVFGALFGLGFTNPNMALVFHGVQALFFLAITIIVIVSAFRESTGQGFMTMCIPCYILFFVYSVCDSGLIKMLYSIAILTRLAGLALPLKMN